MTPEEIGARLARDTELMGVYEAERRIAKAVLAYGDERAREMRERCADIVHVADKVNRPTDPGIGAVCGAVAEKIRALPLEVNDE